jgi:hypothetical protein
MDTDWENKFLMVSVRALERTAVEPSSHPIDHWNA